MHTRPDPSELTISAAVEMALLRACRMRGVPPEVMRRQPDAWTVAHDALIWPVPRAGMTTPQLVAARMSADAFELCRAADPAGEGDCEGVGEADLLALGWTLDQVRAHARDAFTWARIMLASPAPAASGPGHDAAPGFGRPRRESTEALASAAFVLFLACGFVLTAVLAA